MAESVIRQLQASRKFDTLRVPKGYDQNVGVDKKFVSEGDPLPSDMSSLEAEVLGRAPKGKVVEQVGIREPEIVEKAGFDLIARFKKAEDSLGEDRTSLDPLAEHVSTVAREMRGGDGGSPAVSADVAAALLAIKPQTRDMILRRAGNPPEFESLRKSGLAPVPADKKLDAAFAEAGGRARVREEEADLARQQSSERLPMIKRASSVMAQPDKMTAGGTLVKSSQRYKEFKIDDQSPLDEKGPHTLAEERRAQIAEELRAKGKTDKQIEKQIATRVPDPSTQKLTEGQRRALNDLAGDQIAEAKAIEKKYDSGARLPQQVRPGEEPPVLKRTNATPARKPTPAQARILEAAAKGDKTLEELAKAAGAKPDAVRRLLRSGRLAYAGEVRSLPQDQQMWKGTDPNYWEPEDRATGGPNTARTVDYRNKGQATRALQRLYELTAPQTALTEQGAPVHLAADNTSTIDMDSMFPWWRMRFADMDDSGKIVYPKQLPSAEFITGLIESRLKVTDPKFFDRVLPLIRRSIEAAPDQPNPFTESAGTTAYQYSQKVMLPSPSFQAMMKQAVQERTSATPVYRPTAVDYHMQYPIYGPRAVDRPDVEAPERHPFKGEKPSDKAKSQVQKLRELLGKPGLEDQGSIYRMPANSPMRALLA